MSRGAVLRACASELGALLDLFYARDQIASHALTGLGVAAQLAASAADDAAAVELVATEWCGRLEDLARHATNADVERVLEALRGCAAKAHHADPFQELFDEIAGRARVLYDAAWPAASFTVFHLGEPPRAGGDPYAADARVIPAAGARPIELRLTIHPDSFGPATYVALPTILVHECICHVAAQPEGEVNNESVFAEGFMDWAATYYRRTWNATLGPLGDIVEEHAAPLYEAIARAAPRLAIARNRGRRGAQRLAHRLERDHGYEPGESDAAVARLAVELNRADRPLLKKDAFVLRVDRPLDQRALDVIKGRRNAADIL